MPLKTSNPVRKTSNKAKLYGWPQQSSAITRRKLPIRTNTTKTIKWIKINSDQYDGSDGNDKWPIWTKVRRRFENLSPKTVRRSGPIRQPAARRTETRLTNTDYGVRRCITQGDKREKEEFDLVWSGIWCPLAGCLTSDDIVARTPVNRRIG